MNWPSEAFFCLSVALPIRLRLASTCCEWGAVRVSVDRGRCIALFNLTRLSRLGNVVAEVQRIGEGTKWLEQKLSVNYAVYELTRPFLTCSPQRMENDWRGPALVKRTSIALASIVWGLVIAGAAFADPCTARVTGYRPGTSVSGVVTYVGDGDSLCIGSSSKPANWIEVRLVDYFAPELHEEGGPAAKRRLELLASGKQLVCTVANGQNGRTYSYDRLIATCRLSGKNLGDMLRLRGGTEGGRGVPRLKGKSFSDVDPEEAPLPP